MSHRGVAHRPGTDWSNGDTGHELTRLTVPPVTRLRGLFPLSYHTGLLPPSPRETASEGPHNSGDISRQPFSTRRTQKDRPANAFGSSRTASSRSFPYACSSSATTSGE